MALAIVAALVIAEVPAIATALAIEAAPVIAVAEQVIELDQLRLTIALPVVIV